MNKSKRGRKSRLTPELVADIGKLLTEGNTTRMACAMVGISEAAFYKHFKAGESGHGSPRQVEFVETVKKAKVTAQRRAVLLIQTAARTSWQAAAWYLERTCPEEWGRRDFVRTEMSGKLHNEITGPEGQPVALTAVPFTPEEVDEAYRQKVRAEIEAELLHALPETTDVAPTPTK